MTLPHLPQALPPEEQETIAASPALLCCSHVRRGFGLGLLERTSEEPEAVSWQLITSGWPVSGHCAGHKSQGFVFIFFLTVFYFSFSYLLYHVSFLNFIFLSGFHLLPVGFLTKRIPQQEASTAAKVTTDLTNARNPSAVVLSRIERIHKEEATVGLAAGWDVPPYTSSP